VAEVGADAKSAIVYNLEVDSAHAYFVGESHAWVHNGCGKNPRNYALAGKRHPKSGVPFDAEGFPDFSDHRHPDVPDVRISLSGSRPKDSALANAAAGLRSTPEGYVWHHHQDKGLMQLILKSVHEATAHTGGFSGR
jgi:hypothetical protein